MSHGRRTRLILGLVFGTIACIGCNDAEAPPPDTSGEALRGMAPRAPGTEAGKVALEDKEPNDVPEEAIALESKADGSIRAEGVLRGGSGDTDIYILPAGLGLSTLSLVPLSDADVLVGVMPELGSSTVWFDQQPAAGTEWIPNLGGGAGRLLVLRARGDDDVGYRIEIDPVASPDTEGEPNDRPALASDLGLGRMTTAYVNRSGDVDVFRIPPFADAPVTLSVSPPGASHELAVRLESDLGTIWESVASGGQPVMFQGLKPDPQGYRLVVELIGETDKPRVYTISVEQRLAEGSVEFEPNDELAAAQTVVPNAVEPLSASLSSSADVDWYRATLAPSAEASATIASVHLVPAASALNLDLTGKVTFVEDSISRTLASGTAGEAESVCNLALRGPVTVELEVTGTLGDGPLEGGAPYSLEFTTRTAGIEELEPNENNLQPTALTLATPVEAFIHPVGDVDVFAFAVPAVPNQPTARAPVTVSVSDGYAADLKLELKDAHFSEVSNRNARGYGDGESVVAQLPPGEYFAVVKAVEGASCSRPYAISVAIEATYLDAANGSGGIVVPTVDDGPDEATDRPDPATGQPATNDGAPTVAGTPPVDAGSGETGDTDSRGTEHVGEPPATLEDEGAAPPEQLGEDDF